MPAQSLFQFFLVVAMTLLFSTAFSLASAQEDSNGQKLDIGDTIEFEFHNKSVAAEILEFTRLGWPVVNVEFDGRTIEWKLPSNRTKLVRTENEKPTAVQASHSAPELRSWTDSSGKFTVKAKLISSIDGKVKLEKEDGRVINLTLEELSAKDQQYLEELAKAAAENDPENPFAGGVPNPDSNPFEPSGRSNSKTLVESTSNRVRTKILTPTISNLISFKSPADNFQPDPFEPTGKKLDRSIDYSTVMTEHEFHHDYSVCFSRNNKFAAVCISNPFENRSAINIANLETGETIASAEIQIKKLAVMAIADDGKTVITVPKSVGNSRNLDVWNIEGNIVRKTVSWRSSRFRSNSKFRPDAGLFVDPNKLLTLGNHLALWNIDGADCVYSIRSRESFVHSSSPALSPGRNQVALAYDHSIFVIEAETGTVVSELKTGDDPVEQLAFSQSGQLLAGISRSTGSIDVWDIQTRELIQQLGTADQGVKSLHWCGDRYLLINGSELIDVELRTPIWRYDVSRAELVNGHDGRFWIIGSNRMKPIDLPHKDFDDQTATLNPDDLLLLKPGAELSIHFDTVFAPAVEQRILRQMEQNLNSIDVVVTKDAELQLIASVKKLRESTATVRPFASGPFGRRRSTETITYTPHLATISLVKNGNEMWSKSRRFGPGSVIDGNENETSQQTADRLCKPQPEFFSSRKFPRYFAQLPSGKVLGTSEITLEGIQ